MSPVYKFSKTYLQIDCLNCNSMLVINFSNNNFYIKFIVYVSTL